jgi:hypothetical protein
VVYTYTITMLGHQNQMEKQWSGTALTHIPAALRAGLLRQGKQRAMLWFWATDSAFAWYIMPRIKIGANIPAILS